MTKTFPALTLAALLSGTSAHVALAADHSGQMAIGLTGDRTLHQIDLASATVKASMEVEGVTRLLGIDLRPGTGQLIGVTDSFDIIAIDPMTGAVTPVSTMNTPLPVTGETPVIVDFNPMADRLRFMAGTVNHRVNVDTGEVTVDGALAYDPADANAGAAPAIVAAAYINAFGKPDATAMFNIDSGLGALIQQTSPNDGVMVTIGSLGIEASASYAFDVATDAAGTNTAWLVTADKLHILSLETGAVLESRDLQGTGGALLRDITVMTAP